MTEVLKIIMGPKAETYVLNQVKGNCRCMKTRYKMCLTAILIDWARKLIF